jgi:hypothetical protein
VLGDRWLHQAQAVRGAADAEIGLHQGDQGAELAQFHIMIRDKKSKFIISHHAKGPNHTPLQAAKAAHHPNQIIQELIRHAPTFTARSLPPSPIPLTSFSMRMVF